MTLITISLTNTSLTTLSGRVSTVSGPFKFVTPVKRVDRSAGFGDQRASSDRVRRHCHRRLDDPRAAQGWRTAVQEVKFLNIWLRSLPHLTSVVSSSRKMIFKLIVLTINTGLWTAVFAIVVLALVRVHHCAH